MADHTWVQMDNARNTDSISSTLLETANKVNKHLECCIIFKSATIYREYFDNLGESVTEGSQVVIRLVSSAILLGTYFCKCLKRRKAFMKIATCTSAAPPTP